MSPEQWERVKAVFDRMVERDPLTREAALNEACGSDAELRREVESLLSADTAAGSLLERPAFQPAHRTSPSLNGRRIGNYLIGAELARGGMGVVYRGRHVSLPRDVVVKVINTGGLTGEASAGLRARFRREAYIQCQLDHPHIVRVYEFFADDEDCFLVMEYVPGSSLRELLKQRGALPASEAAALASAALEGLHHAHTFRYTVDGATGVGIVHRDVKPANILVDPAGHVKLTDFGIAKLQSGGELTRTGGSPGTAEYMAPEQILGRPVDARTDVYGMGISLYQVLSGNVPFRRTSPSSDFDVLRAHVEAEPPPLRDVPAALAEVVYRAIAKDPADRWQSAAEFLEALLPHRITSVATRPRRRIAAPSRRAVVICSSAVLLAALAGAGAYLWPRRLPEATLAVLPLARIGPDNDDEYFSDGLTEEILNDLSRVPGLRVTGRTSAFRFKDKTADIKQIGKMLHVDAVLEGSVRRQGSNLRIALQLVKTGDGFQLWSETYDRGIHDILGVQEEIARTVAAALKVTLLRQAPASPPPSGEAYNAYLQGHYFLTRNRPKAIGYFERALQLDPKFARAWEGIAEAWYNEAGTGTVPADEGYRRAREAVNRAIAFDPNLADGHIMLGLIQFQHDWDWDAAGKSYRRAGELAPGDPSVMRATALLLRTRGRLEEALVLYRRAIDIDPLHLGAPRQYGVTLHFAGREAEALTAIRKTLELAPDIGYTHNLLAQVHLAQSLPQAALLEANQEGSPIFRAMALALVHHALGNKSDSEAQLTTLVSKYQDAAPYQIAEVYSYRGDIDQAFAWLDRAYTTRDGGITDMKCDPLLAPLHADPRYRALLTRLRL
jgi:eukaryotic-like serine/threonine-protein kinase